MNILIVCDYFLDYLGGAQTAIAAQAEALRDAGHRVTLVAPRRQRVTSGAAAPDRSFFSPVVLPVLDMAIVRNSAKTRGVLAGLVDELSIDVVHVHSEFGLAAAAIQVAAAAGVPSVHTVHTLYWRSGLRSSRAIAGLIHWLHRRVTGLDTPLVHLSENAVDNALRGMTLAVALRADTVVSPSAHQAVDLRLAGAHNVVCVANCVAPDAGLTASEVRDVNEPLRVLWVGRCVPEKRVVEFAHAAAIACEAVGAGRLQVTFAGAGPLVDQVSRIAAGSPDLRVLGRVPNSAIRGLLEAHHATALTSFGYDNQPMTVAESIAEFRGVIYVDPRLREGLDSAGIFVADRSVEGMAAALVELARDPRAVVTASHHSIAARELFTSQAHAAALERIYLGQEARKRVVRATGPASRGSLTPAQWVSEQDLVPAAESASSGSVRPW